MQLRRAQNERGVSRRDLTSAVRCTYMHLTYCCIHAMYGTYMLHGHTHRKKRSRGAERGAEPLFWP